MARRRNFLVRNFDEPSSTGRHSRSPTLNQMTQQLRVIHWLSEVENPERLLAYCANVREAEGDVEAECYASIEDEGLLAIAELWASVDAFGAYWRAASTGEWNDTLYRLASGRDAGWQRTELYMQQRFARNIEFRPEAAQDASSIVCWPSRGPVRLVIPGCVDGLDEAIPRLLENARDTRREPGCLEYRWWHSLEFPGQTLLLELWQSQPVYDFHWQLRRKTGEAARLGPAPQRRYGSSGVELYHHEAYTYLYDRWLPVDQGAWSETVAWPQ